MRYKSEKTICLACGIMPPKTSRYLNYCDDRCRHWNLKVNSELYSFTKTNICNICHKAFTPTITFRSVICSKECNKLNKVKNRALYMKRKRQRPYFTNAYRLNPQAPRKCESCKYDISKILELCHKPQFKINGQKVNRTKLNSSWPEHTWILCPNCHTLLDKKVKTPEELGLQV